MVNGGLKPKTGSPKNRLVDKNVEYECGSIQYIDFQVGHTISTYALGISHLRAGC